MAAFAPAARRGGALRCTPRPRPQWAPRVVKDGVMNLAAPPTPTPATSQAATKNAPPGVAANARSGYEYQEGTTAKNETPTSRQSSRNADSTAAKAIHTADLLAAGMFDTDRPERQEQNDRGRQKQGGLDARDEQDGDLDHRDDDSDDRRDGPHQLDAGILRRTKNMSAATDATAGSRPVPSHSEPKGNPRAHG